MEQTSPLPNPPVLTETPINPLVNSSSSNKSVLIVLLVIFFAVLSSLITYLLVKSQTSFQTPVASPTPIVQTSPAPTPDPTADWKTYKNEKYGFQIKYHPDLNPKETPGSGEKSKIFISFGTLKDNYSFDIRVAEKNNLDYYRWELVGHVTDKIDIEEKVLLDNREGTKLTFLQFLSTSNISFSRVIVFFNNFDYIITAKTIDIDQILSPFKFLE